MPTNESKKSDCKLTFHQPGPECSERLTLDSDVVRSCIHDVGCHSPAQFLERCAASGVACVGKDVFTDINKKKPISRKLAIKLLSALNALRSSQGLLDGRHFTLEDLVLEHTAVADPSNACQTDMVGPEENAKNVVKEDEIVSAGSGSAREKPETQSTQHDAVQDWDDPCEIDSTRQLTPRRVLLSAVLVVAVGLIFLRLFFSEPDTELTGRTKEMTIDEVEEPALAREKAESLLRVAAAQQLLRKLDSRREVPFSFEEKQQRNADKGPEELLATGQARLLEVNHLEDDEIELVMSVDAKYTRRWNLYGFWSISENKTPTGKLIFTYQWDGNGYVLQSPRTELIESEVSSADPGHDSNRLAINAVSRQLLSLIGL